MERSITFAVEDLALAFQSVGIDFASVTDDEWRKFEDAFVAGTDWDEVARHAADVVAQLRGSDASSRSHCVRHCHKTQKLVKGEHSAL
jgi:hypothetical protein